MGKIKLNDVIGAVIIFATIYIVLIMT